MTAEQTYERMVEGLTQKWDAILLRRAHACIARYPDDSPEDVFSQAREDVETSLFHNAYWESVEAVDISDIAGEYVEQAMNEAS